MPRRIIPLLLVLVVLLVSSGIAYHPPPTVTATATEEPRRGPVGPPSFGVNAHLATRYPDPTSMHVPGAELSELGVAWVREDFHWYRIQPRRNVWDWHFNDAAVRELVQRDINILGVIGGPSAPWATPYPGDGAEYASFYAPSTADFVAFARGVVTRYRRYIDHWEIWNEPESEHFWKPHPDPAAYADLLIRTSAAIKAIDPDATVLIGGINPYQTDFLRDVLQANTWNSFDVLAIHPYVDPASPEESNLANVVEHVRVLTERYGDKPIWVTEIGWASGPGDHDPLGTTSEAMQADYLVRSLLLLWGAGVEHVFWYNLKDDEGNPYGLIALGRGRLDYRRRKPAFVALRTLIGQTRNATFQERRDLFTHTPLLDFTEAAMATDEWKRPVQPNGTFQASGIDTARLNYNFTTPGNDYVTFEREHPLPLSGRPHALGVWVYGDGSGHALKAWIRDAEGELLQFRLGFIGLPGWQFLSASIQTIRDDGDRIAGHGNGRLDPPAAFQAFVLDDLNDEYQGTGTLYLDNLTLINGPEVYDMRFERGDLTLDIIWSPPRTRVSIKTAAASGHRIGGDGIARPIAAPDGQFSLIAGPTPLYLWH